MTTKPPFWLGGLAASVAAACTHPLDLAKVRMQMTCPTVQRGFVGTLSSTVSGNGFLALYQGLSAALLRQLTYSTVRFAAYEYVKDRLAAGGKPSSSQLMLAGAIAGGLGGVAGNPADIVLVRMTSDCTLPPAKQRNYRHAVDGVLRVVREEGTVSLARGILPNTLRAMLMTSSQMASYDVAKSFFLNSKVSTFRMEDGPIAHFLSSCVAALVATTVCSPADVIKCRVMAQQNASITEVISRSLRNEGPRFLFKGWTPSFIRLGPNTVLLFLCLEQFKRAWYSWTGDKP